MSINYQLFPRNIPMIKQLDDVISAFNRIFIKIDSSKFKLKSNDVLKIVCPEFLSIKYKVETGKKDNEKIIVPVLYGINGKIDKKFEADGINEDGTIVIEVEAGRAVLNNQFLKDIFQASMMDKVEYLVLAVRKTYKNKRDFDEVYTFLETMYVSNRIQLDLKGILLIGY